MNVSRQLNYCFFVWSKVTKAVTFFQPADWQCGAANERNNVWSLLFIRTLIFFFKVFIGCRGIYLREVRQEVGNESGGRHVTKITRPGLEPVTAASRTKVSTHGRALPLRHRSA